MDYNPPACLPPWNFPHKNTGVGCHFLLQGIFPTQELNSPLLHWQMDSLPLGHLVQREGRSFQTVLGPSVTLRGVVSEAVGGIYNSIPCGGRVKKGLYILPNSWPRLTGEF